MKISIFFINLVFLLSFQFSQAEEDAAILEKARTRQYVGGVDESDLKVQAQLVKLQKSKNETTIEEAAEGF